MAKRTVRLKRLPQKEKVEQKVELEFLQGLRPFVLDELRTYKGARVVQTSAEAIQIEFSGELTSLLTLRRVTAAYLITQFDVPRPKALLGDQHFRRLLSTVEQVRSLHPKGMFSSFRFGAAGSASSVFQRLAEAISKATKLRYQPDEGELLLRVRPSDEGWEVLTRLTPRPLSARVWRVCNLPGGLNACLGVAMNDLAKVKPGERYLNAMCGSGTLLIEQALAKKPERLVGLDLDAEALECARQNVAAASLEKGVELRQADTTALEFPDHSFDVVTADVPWGDAVGSHAENAALYPAFLAEMVRVTAPRARLVVLTHDLKLFKDVLAKQRVWQARAEVRVFHGGHYPRMFLLTKEDLERAGA